MKIGIVGTGWYGCYIAEYLLDNYKNIDITMIDKNDEIFKSSSSHNQNRLHIGFHYPRCTITQSKCKKYFELFNKKYSDILMNMNKNYYIIADNSNISFNDYIKMYDNYELIKNNFLNNIQQNNIINTKEKYIDFLKAKEYFKKKLANKVNYIFNYHVKTIENRNNKVIINNKYLFDKVFNCTYNQVQTFENVIYEKCLTLLYKKVKKVPFDCLTIMDGKYSSIFYYKDDIYSLTNVKYTPLIKSKNFNEVKLFDKFNINDSIKNFEKEIKYFYKSFQKDFTYYSYYISYKCKEITTKDTRDINIKINNNIFNVFSGKITLVFELDNYIKNFLLYNDKGIRIKR